MTPEEGKAPEQGNAACSQNRHLVLNRDEAGNLSIDLEATRKANTPEGKAETMRILNESRAQALEAQGLQHIASHHHSSVGYDNLTLLGRERQQFERTQAAMAHSQLLTLENNQDPGKPSVSIS